MTVTQLIKKYKEIAKTKAEYVSLGEVINDLWQVKSTQNVYRIPVNKR